MDVAYQNAKVIAVNGNGLGLQFTDGSEVPEGVNYLRTGNYIPQEGHEVAVLMIGNTPLVLGMLSDPDEVPPYPPSDVRAVAGVGSLAIFWSEPDDERMKPGRGTYQVEIDVSKGFESPQAISMIANGTSAYFTGLINRTTYYVRVKSITGLGCSGPFSDPIEAAPDLETLRQQISAKELQAIILKVDDYICSTVYTPGVAGWIIKADGNTELNNIVARGRITAASITASQISSTEGTNLTPNGTFDANVLTWTPTNCTLARDTVLFRTGTASMKITATALGDMSVLSDQIPVEVAAEYVGRFSARCVSAQMRPGFFYIRWYQQNGTLISSVGAANGGEPVGVWTRFNYDAIAPPLAAYARIQIGWSAVGAGEIHNVDDVSFVRSSVFIGRFATGVTGPRAELGMDVQGDPSLNLHCTRDGQVAPAKVLSFDDPYTDQPTMMIETPDYGTMRSYIYLMSESSTDPATYPATITARTDRFEAYHYGDSFQATLEGDPIVTLAGHTEYRGGADTPYAYSGNGNTAWADVDANNLKVAFYNPLSGIVIAELEAAVKVASATSLQFGLRNGNALVAGSEMTMLEIPGGYVRVRASLYLTGVIVDPGFSEEIIWKWAWRSKTANVTLNMAKGPTMGPCIMRVWNVLA